MNQVTLKRFEEPDETQSFPKGSFMLVRVGGMSIGRASYEPGWRWSIHVSPTAGTPTCQVAHVGMVVSGHAMIEMDDGTAYELGPGDVFAIAPGHDSWVIGDEPYVSLHFRGADEYARPTDTPSR